MAFASEGGNKLVHDTAGHSGKIVLRLLAKQRLFHRIESGSRDRFQQRGGANLERGTAAQATAQRHGGMQEHVETARLDAALQEAGDNATRVIPPFWRGQPNGPGKINRSHLGLQSAAQRDDLPAIDRPVCRHHAVILDGHRQDEAVVVIGVLADDVDTARGGGDPARRTTVELFKFGGDMGGEVLEFHDVF